ncbi:hint-domain-containing protein [Chaetomium strumarium]|uniref:Hint-domain-containing protein n=1 Tax=Chaetomium strumarium TaxID=1170767 RepID=A0AAJ0LZA4_9PEZI|nr:hint-domain-containing protein [Chaetomium strumarium]
MTLTKIFTVCSDGTGSTSDSSAKDPNARRGTEKQNQDQGPSVHIYPFSSEDGPDGVIVKIQPPSRPADGKLEHVPCDLVLSIDVSGSMANAAPVPSRPGRPADDSGEEEEYGLSVLDLVKHGARTIIETLDARDRLGIVTFSTHTEVLQSLTPMTAESKAAAVEKIERMKPLDMTNLWHGIRDGLDLFRESKSKDNPPGSGGRVPALLVLTDGIPNHMCPPQGYVPKLQKMGPLPATIHTFGFGYRLESGLLKSVAEAGGGNYSFIPDAGMLGTVFIHAVANLQSTFANNARLRLTYPSYLGLQETTGEAVDKQEPLQLGGDVPDSLASLTILLSNVQYGQSRDVYLRFGTGVKVIQAEVEAGGSSPPIITAALDYQRFAPETHQAVAYRHALDIFSGPQLDRAEIAYHVSRSALVSFLSTIYPLKRPQLEHCPLRDPPSDLPTRLQALLASLPAANPEFASSHPGCRSLLTDLCGADFLNFDHRRLEDLNSNPATAAAASSSSSSSSSSSWTAAGQIALALLDGSYYRRWGMHYLPSIAGAHARQVCNSFKDAGPLRYGVDSPLFAACRERLDDAFEQLPAPAPSRTLPVRCSSRGGGGGRGPPLPVLASMKRYHDVENGCFAGCAKVLLATGRTVRIARLRKGMEVITPRGPRKVMAILRMEARRAAMCRVTSADAKRRLLVTPWHPILLALPGCVWAFPKDVPMKPVRYSGPVYSVLLERDEDANAHAIMVGGTWGVTMGHGLTEFEEGKPHDVRAHQFYGDYSRVSRALAMLPRTAGGVVLGRGLTRDPETGRVNGLSSSRARKSAFRAQV